MTKNPIEWIELEDLEEVEGIRWLDCPTYEDCLDIAAREDWEGWTCLFCSFQKEHRKEKTNE